MGRSAEAAFTPLDIDIDAFELAAAAVRSDAAADESRASTVDFQRPVHALLGLPVDAVDMSRAVEAVRRAAFSGTPYMISTPNLNFVVGALSDGPFRESVTASDLNLADGMPLVWVARLLGVPLRERVSGAGLFEALAAHPEPPVTVFFFGGPDGAARAAAQRVNGTARGLRCVGFAAPGFGSVEEMSADAYLSRINACRPHFVVAALGAKKGQAWLQRNRLRLAAPVRCHLGAVINFAAGTVRRAPAPVQRLGLEWLWRITQEPALWRRYAGDGLAFLRLLATGVAPLAWARRFGGPPETAWAQARVALSIDGDTATLTLAGPWGERNLQPVRDALAEAAASAARLRLAMAAATHVDSAFIGLLMIAPRAFRLGVEWIDTPPALQRTLRRHRAGWLLAGRGAAS
jgi:N-acetylglucosaminyldiphosphoundecaprenol N-acetyl-beta-D-mannosaminyltransferase